MDVITVLIIAIVVLFMLLVFMFYLWWQSEKDNNWLQHEIIRLNNVHDEDIKRVSEQSTKYGIEVGKRIYLEQKYLKNGC